MENLRRFRPALFRPLIILVMWLCGQPPAFGFAPTVPTGLRVVPVSTSENIVQWKASSHPIDVAGYKVYRNDIQIATTQFVTYYNDTGLAANTTYSYRVSAFEAAGNTSAQTDSVPGTTHTNGSNVIVGNPSNPAALRQEIVNAYNAGAKSVTIKPGTYIIPESGDLAAITLKSLNNFIINGYGVTISSIQTEAEAFGTFWCNNLVIRGITIQYNNQTYAQGVITAAGTTDNEHYLEVQLEPGYRQNPTGTGGQNVANFKSIGFVFDPMTHLWKYRAENQEQTMSNAANDLGEGKWRLYYNGSLPSNVVAGDLIAFRGLGHHLFLCWVTFDSTFQDITMRQGGTFGVKEDRSGRNHYYGIKVTYGPKPAGATNDPLLSQSVDGFHSIQAQGGPDVQDAVIEGMGDDAIAIMGFYRTVVSVSGNTITVTPDDISEATYPSFRVGDPIRITGADGFMDQATVVGVAMDGPNVRVTLDKRLAAQAGYLASNPNHVGSDYQLINNTVRTNRARGMFLRGNGGKVLNNTIDGSTIQGIHIAAPESFFGGEADFAWDILISNNTIKNCGFATNNGQSSGIELDSEITASGFRGHRNITIRNNKIDRVSGVNVLVRHAQGITINNNAFLNPHQDQVSNPTVNPYVIINIDACTDISIAGNTVTNPGQYETGLLAQGANCQNVTSGW